MSFNVDDYSWPAYQGRKPFEHQKVTTAFILKHKRCLVLNDMGTGKTLAALWACDILFVAQKIRRVLIVSPKSTMQAVWYNEIMMNMPHRTAGIAHGSPAIRERVLKSGCQFVIINHDGIKNNEMALAREQFDVIIIDELTAFKNNSDRTKCMVRLTKDTKSVVGMTGELTPNEPTEAFWPCKIVVPHNQYLPRWFGQFRDATMVCVNEQVWVPKPEASNIIAMCAQPAIRYTREQCLDLPETTYITLETPLSPEQIHHYEIMRKKALIEYDGGTVSAANAAVKLNKLLQISAGAVKDDHGDVIEIGCPDRIQALMEIYAGTPNKKLVVFATYRATIEMLLKAFRSAFINVAAIHGDISMANRNAAIDRFQNGDLNVLILQPQSAAHGITLTAASTLVWFSILPSNEYFGQGNARVVRAGQRNFTFIYMFVSTQAEKRMAALLQRRGDMSAEVQALFRDHLL